MLYTVEEIEDFKGWITDHICVSVECDRDPDNMPADFPPGNYVFFEIDDYRPGEDEEWDEDLWDSRKCYLYVSLSSAPRIMWKNGYRIARSLSKHGKVFIQNILESSLIEIPCTTFIYLKRQAA